MGTMTPASTTSAPQAAGWRHVVRESFRVSKDQVNALGAIRCTVGVLIPLVIGLAAGSVADGLAGAVGALAGGFASFQGTYRTRAAIILAVGAGMAVSTVTGALAEHSAVGTAFVDAAWGVAGGMMVALGPALLVIGLQWGVGALVAAAIPMNTGQALVRGSLVLAGALIQMVLAALVWPLRSYRAERRAVAASYQALSSFAQDIAGGELLSRGPAMIDDARAVLRDPQPFGRAGQQLAFQALLDEADRIRINLVRIARLRSLLPAAVSQLVVTRLARAVAGTLDEISHTIEKERLPAVVAAFRSGSSPADSAPDLDGAIRDLESAVVGAQPAWAAEELQQSTRALGGQVRSAGRVAMVTVGERDVTGTTPVMRPGPKQSLAHRTKAGVDEALITLRANLSWDSSAFRHAVRLGAVLAVCVAVARIGDVARGYWVGLTALVVLRPDFVTTATRGLGRLVGTLAGAVVATALVAWLRPGTVGLTVLFGCAVFFAFAILRANYALFSIFITGYVVFLLSFAKLPAFATVTDRVVDTLLGGGIAVAAYLVWPTWESHQVGEHLARLLEAQRDYAGAVLGVHADPGDNRRASLGDLRARTRRARSNAEASVQRLSLEPERGTRSGGLDVDTASGVLAAARRFSLGTLTLHAHLPDRTDPPRPDLVRLAEAIPSELTRVAEAMRSHQPPSAGGLRDIHNALPDELTDSVPLVVSETDLMVDSVNTIAELLTAQAGRA